MIKSPIDHSIGSHSLVALPEIPHLFVIAAFALILAFVLVTIFWVATLTSRVLRLSSNIVGREKAVASLAAELEAQALLARQMSIDLEELRKRLPDREGVDRSETPLWSTSSVAVNLNRRGQILRLSRKGKSIPEIAQDMNVSQGEVQLLLKVHDLGQKIPS